MKSDRIGLVIVLASLAAISAIAYLVFQYQLGDRLQDIRNEGVSLVKLCDGLPDFLVTDIDMPRMSGT